MAPTPKKWEVEDNPVWEESGKRIANRTLWVSIPNLVSYAKKERRNQMLIE